MRRSPERTTVHPDTGLVRSDIDINEIECEECGTAFENEELFRQVKTGLWDRETQRINGAKRVKNYCSDCWIDKYEREAAAHWAFDSIEEVFAVLESSNGSLVADLSHLFRNGPFVRIVDGELNVLTFERESRLRGNTIILEHHPVYVDVDRESFKGEIREAAESFDEPKALVKPVEETAFQEAPAPDQATFEEMFGE